MTPDPDQVAAENILNAVCPHPLPPGMLSNLARNCANCLATALRQAREAEREQCAKIAAHHEATCPSPRHMRGGCAQVIADTLRRGPDG